MEWACPTTTISMCILYVCIYIYMHSPRPTRRLTWTGHNLCTGRGVLYIYIYGTLVLVWLLVLSTIPNNYAVLKGGVHRHPCMCGTVSVYGVSVSRRALARDKKRVVSPLYPCWLTRAVLISTAPRNQEPRLPENFLDSILGPTLGPGPVLINTLPRNQGPRFLENFSVLKTRSRNQDAVQKVFWESWSLLPGDRVN